jgi:hypothetical protein
MGARLFGKLNDNDNVSRKSLVLQADVMCRGSSEVVCWRYHDADNVQIEDSADTIFKLGMCMHELYKQDPQHADGRNRRDIAQGALEWGKYFSTCLLQ